jgi:hypothetical protein
MLTKREQGWFSECINYAMSRQGVSWSLGGLAPLGFSGELITFRAEEQNRLSEFGWLQSIYGIEL